MRFSKTITYALVTFIGVLSLPEVQQWITEHPTYAVLGNSMFIAILRYLTISPLFNDKENDNDKLNKDSSE